MNDPELLELPLKIMDLVSSNMKILKAQKILTIGNSLACRPSELSAFGIAKPGLIEIEKAAKEMGLVWDFAHEIETSGEMTKESMR